MTQDSLAACVERIDALVGKIELLSDSAVREDVQEIVQRMLEYHGAALARLLSLLPQATGVGAQQAMERLAADELVSSLLLLHGLHPADLETRVEEALERTRPFLQSHGGNVELARIDEGVVHLRLHGSCHGCPSSAATLKTRIEQAIYEAAPEVESIRVEDEAVHSQPNGFVSLEKLTVG